MRRYIRTFEHHDPVVSPPNLHIATIRELPSMFPGLVVVGIAKFNAVFDMAIVADEINPISVHGCTCAAAARREPTMIKQPRSNTN
jgi:hypothetical protein